MSSVKRLVIYEKQVPSTRRCNFCRSRDLAENGKISITLSEDKGVDHKETWFCSECCMNMNKYERGYPTMKKEQYLDILKKCYPKLYNH